MIPAKLESALYAVVATPVLNLADRHGIVASLIDDGPQRGEEVARRLGLNEDTTERLLLVLTAVELVHRSEDGMFSVVPDVTPFLDADDPNYIGGYVQHMVEGTPACFEQLDAYLVSGKDAVDGGQPPPYERVYRDEESTRDFMRAMWDLSFGVSAELARLADLGDRRRLVDVGGANGPFAVAALQEAPLLTAVVFDLPRVEPYLAETSREHGLEGRLHFVGGDFFADPLPSGDVIALGYVLSNWTDEVCRRLLEKVYDACAPGGVVLVMDRLYDDDKGGPVSAAVMNLLMHVETNGRHRSAAEFTALLEGAGFGSCEVRESGQDKHLVIGHKAAV